MIEELALSQKKQKMGYGYTVVRFWNNDVLANSDGVVEEIRALLKIART